MSRQARIRTAGGVYHVTMHGTGDEMIFGQPSDKWRLLDFLADTAEDLDWAHRPIRYVPELTLRTHEKRSQRKTNGADP